MDVRELILDDDIASATNPMEVVRKAKK